MVAERLTPGGPRPVKVVRRNFVLKRMPFEYLVGSDPMSFYDASGFCRKWGGDLVSITDRSE